MNKISVNVRVPALGNSFNFIVPSNLKIFDVKKLMLRILNAEYGIKVEERNLQLIERQTSKVLSPNNTFEELNIIDGDELVLL